MGATFNMAAVLARFLHGLPASPAIFCRKTLKVRPESNINTFQIRKRLMCVVSSKKEVNGVEIYHDVAGRGYHVVLCMPGALGSTQSDFGPQLKGLSDDFTVVAFDPRGYGKSVPPKRDFPADFFARDADDAAGLMEALGKTLTTQMGQGKFHFIPNPPYGGWARDRNKNGMSPGIYTNMRNDCCRAPYLIIIGRSREGALGAQPPLSFNQTEARRTKKYFLNPPPPPSPLSQGLDDCPAPLI